MTIKLFSHFSARVCAFAFQKVRLFFNGLMIFGSVFLLGRNLDVTFLSKNRLLSMSWPVWMFTFHKSLLSSFLDEFGSSFFLKRLHNSCADFEIL